MLATVGGRGMLRGPEYAGGGLQSGVGGGLVSLKTGF